MDLPALLLQLKHADNAQQWLSSRLQNMNHKDGSLFSLYLAIPENQRPCGITKRSSKLQMIATLMTALMRLAFSDAGIDLQAVLNALRQKDNAAQWLGEHLSALDHTPNQITSGGNQLYSRYLAIPKEHRPCNIGSHSSKHQMLHACQAALMSLAFPKEYAEQSYSYDLESLVNEVRLQGDGRQWLAGHLGNMMHRAGHAKHGPNQLYSVLLSIPKRMMPRESQN